jgi:rhodanese-related sulfurtransferase
MRKALTSMVVALLATAMSAEAADNAPAQATTAPSGATRVYQAKSPKLGRAELDALLTKPDQILVVDVRRPDEVTAIGGLPVFLSIQADELESRRAFIPKDRIIVTVSNHAGRAGIAADLLATHGFNVAGAVGVQDYEAEGGTLKKIAPQPLRGSAELQNR